MGNEIIEVSINQVEVFSIIASVTSIVLGVLAICLSILFYKMSDKSAKEAEKSSSKIDANVNKLEMLFDKLYSGTFDMMRETVTDMRKHVYMGNDTGKEFKEEIEKNIEMKTKEVVSGAVVELRKEQKSDEEIEELVMELISKSKKLESEVKTNIIKEEILKYLEMNSGVSYGELQNYLIDEGILKNDKDSSLFKEISNLSDEKIIEDPFERENDGSRSIFHSKQISLYKAKSNKRYGEMKRF